MKEKCNAKRVEGGVWCDVSREWVCMGRVVDFFLSRLGRYAIILIRHIV